MTTLPISIRPAQECDAAAVAELYRKVYPTGYPYSPQTLRRQIHSYPEGVYVATRGDSVVGYCATLRKVERAVFQPHTWLEITGRGTGEGHDPQGDWLYGYEIFVDPERQGQGIGRQLYETRASLCRRRGLKGIAICGRLPGLKQRLVQLGSVQNYLRALQAGEFRDPTFTFQANQGFEFQRLMPGYLPVDTDSLGYAAFMIWPNPAYRAPAARLEHDLAVATAG
jgi:GNAT superfamily N-acetyltransferase